MNTRTRSRLLLAASATLLGACAGSMYSQPYVEFVAEQRSPTQDTRPAFVMRVDGQTVTMGRDEAFSPGVHKVEVSIPGPPGMSSPDRDEIEVDAKPCTRYYFAAKRSSRTARDWEAFVAAAEPMGECKKKFGM